MKSVFSGWIPAMWIAIHSLSAARRPKTVRGAEHEAQRQHVGSQGLQDIRRKRSSNAASTFGIL